MFLKFFYTPLAKKCYFLFRQPETFYGQVVRGLSHAHIDLIQSLYLSFDFSRTFVGVGLRGIVKIHKNIIAASHCLCHTK
ncbi:MAG: hypothetical protein IKH45_04505 [Neisseriaceae bacterium]|nr:hypothetical protein [Neisseriaceae bacterium]